MQDKVEEKIIRDLIKRAGISIVISFGNPYVLRYFMELMRSLLHIYKQSSAVISINAKGEIAFQGHLPVELKN